MSINITTNRDEKEKQFKAIWDDTTTEAFTHACVDETLKGNRPNGHLSKEWWKNVIRIFREKTRRNYDQRQMKNKSAILKKRLADKDRLGWK